ncbi:MAG TPA: EF-hand domain-containing protein [Solirubrobacterales bacterium]|jgi:hypothetical protein
MSLALAAEASAEEKAPQAPAKPRSAPGEVENPYAERFEQLDRNRDGYVSLAEWPLDPASFNRVDRDQDGRLSRSELLTPNVVRRDTLVERFRELDTNRDGCVSWSEWQRGHGGFETPDRDADRPRTRREYEARNIEDVWNPRATAQEQRRFRNLDRNRDGRLTRLEWTGSSADFERLDRNRDGVLSPREWP